MPIEVQWSSKNKSTLEFSPLAPFDWPMMYPAIDEIVRLAGSRTEPIVLLISPGALQMPKSSFPLPYIRHFFRMLPPNIRLIVVDMSHQRYFERQIIRIISQVGVTKCPISVVESDHELETAINA